MKQEIEISKKTFTAKDGSIVPYVSFVLVIDGREFSLIARPEDKKLLNYILEEKGFLK